MSPATDYNSAAVLRAGRLIAAELAGEAVDPASDLTMTERRAIAALSLAVDSAVSRRANVEPCTSRAGAWLADELAGLSAP